MKLRQPEAQASTVPSQITRQPVALAASTRPAAACSGCRMRPGLGQPVQRDRQQDDGHADLDRQADLQRLQQLQQLLPQPGMPMKLASTTIARLCMMTWLTPIRISVRAVGMRTRVSSCQRVVAAHLAALDDLFGRHCFKPSSVIRIIGGTEKMMVTIAPALGPTPMKTTTGIM